MKTENNDILWTATYGRILTLDNLILTLDNLMLRDRSLENWCCMCRCNGEFVDHLLLHCPIVPTLWVYILQVFGIQWVMLGSMAGLLFCWHH